VTLFYPFNYFKKLIASIVNMIILCHDYLISTLIRIVDILQSILFLWDIYE